MSVLRRLRPLLAGAAQLVCLGGLAACASLVPAPAFQAWTGYPDRPAGYLGPQGAPDAARLLPPPPAEGSARSVADLAVYRATRALQGSPRWALAAADAELDTPRAPAALACALGVEPSPERTPALVTLLGRVMTDVDAALQGAKGVHARPRPFVAEPRPVCLSPVPAWLARSGSYPSGHAATGWAWSLVLAQVAPERAEALHRRGLAYGDSRVVCGVHYLSDVEAGRAVGAAVVARLDTNAAFRADLARVRRELAALRAQGAAPPARCAAEARALDRPAF